MTPSDAGQPGAWWESGVLYQVYPRSFADSDGDGIGDLGGVLARLEHLEWLGIDGIWLSPITVSPQADFGYDVADYCDVDPAYGTLAQLDQLVAEAARRGIRILLDLVPNHTSSEHPWFKDAVADPASEKRDFYVFADAKQDGSHPNNWVSTFGGPAWELDKASGQYYLHNFLAAQPDLNWWNDEVRLAFDEILRFWFDRGIAGFRIDVCHMMIKDKELRDNPPATENDPFLDQVFGQRSVYNSGRPEAHEILRRWRVIADTYDPPSRVLLGETNVDTLERLATYLGNGRDELNLGFNFPFVEAPFDALALRSIVEDTERLFPPDAWPVWTGSNHDVSRLASRWADGDPAKVRSALMMLLTFRGTCVLYQGDEIGLVDGPITEADVLDPVGKTWWPAYKGRDPERTPMPWDASRHGGFTTGTPWLPMTEPAKCNVADQRGDDTSILHFTKGLVALRRRSRDLGLGAYRSLPSPEGTWVYRRGEATTVALNLSEETVQLAGLEGEIALATTSGRAGTFNGSLEVGPFEGVIVEV